MDRPRHKRTARAEATLRLDTQAHAELENSPVLHTARVAGVIAARRAGEVLPYAPDAEVGSLDVTFDWAGDDLHISAHISGLARASLGSRALLACQVCAATIVDMLPGHAHAVVEQAQITEERGGLDGLAYHFDPPLKAAVVTISDAVKAGHKEDRAAEIVRQELADLADQGVSLVDADVLGDDRAAIDAEIRRLVAADVDLVLTVGGTGLAHTDVTVDTVEPMLERSVPGIMEAARAYGQELTPLAFMSRGVAGLIDDTLVVTLPGSRAGARESCEALMPALLHVFKTLRKSRHLLNS